jgi:hypothetical protein
MTPTKFKSEIERMMETYGRNAVVFEIISPRQPLPQFVTLSQYASGLNPNEKSVCNRAFIKNLEEVLRKKKPIVKRIR